MNSTVHSEINPNDLLKESAKVLPALSHLQHSAGPNGPQLKISLDNYIEPSYSNHVNDKLPFLKKNNPIGISMQALPGFETRNRSIKKKRTSYVPPNEMRRNNNYSNVESRSNMFMNAMMSPLMSPKAELF